MFIVANEKYSYLFKSLFKLTAFICISRPIGLFAVYMQLRIFNY